MIVRKFAIADASFVRSPRVGRKGIRRKCDRPVPHERIQETLAVDDVMVILEGRLSVSTDASTVTAGPGDIVYMRKGESVTIRSHEQGAVTYPHWQEALA